MAYFKSCWGLECTGRPVSALVTPRFVGFSPSPTSASGGGWGYCASPLNRREAWQILLVKAPLALAPSLCLPPSTTRNWTSGTGLARATSTPPMNNWRPAWRCWQAVSLRCRPAKGKTVAIALAAIAHAAQGETVHVLTTNDYLAQRDCQLLAPVYGALGFSTAAIVEPMDGIERAPAYRCDIVYGTLREFGFDYLRDNLSARPQERVQTPLQVAIVDEADQALVDQADTPLIISGGPVSQGQQWRRVQRAVGELTSSQRAQAQQYLQDMSLGNPSSKSWGISLVLATLADPDHPEVRRLAGANPRAYRLGLGAIYPDGGDVPDEVLTSQLFYLVDGNQRFVTLTDRGLDFLSLRLGNVFDAPHGSSYQASAERRPSRREQRGLELANQVYQSLRANLLLKRDVDYLVADDSIALLDQYTGRTKPDNTYRFGLQQAVEAKEGVTVQPHRPSLAQISVPGFAAKYQSLAGITGTAVPATEEFQRRYGLAPVAIAPSQPSQRTDLPTRIYESQQAKLAALVEEVAGCQQVGRPVLVGVRTVEASMGISQTLKSAGIRHRLLNAVTGDEEASIVRCAGELGAVTVATHMAGRGTDIVIEGNLDEGVLDGWVAWLSRRVKAAPHPVQIRCNSAAEADLLAARVAGCPELTLGRFPGAKGLVLEVAASAGEQMHRSDTQGLGPAEFGLGLHVISAEYNRFPRVAAQLRGRSGRQGVFGSTRMLLAWDDPQLLPLGHRQPKLTGCQQTDAGNRKYWEGEPVERFVERLPAEAEQESANRRGLASDFAAVIDAHSAKYYLPATKTGGGS